MRRALPALALCLAALAGPAAAAPLTLVLPHDALTVLPARVAAARALYPGMEGRLVARAVAVLHPAFPADPRVTPEQVEATLRLLARPGGAPSVSFDALVAGEFAAEEVSR